MRRHRKMGMAAALVVYLLATRAAAEPAPSQHMRMRDPSSLTVKSGRTFELPPGRFIEEELFQKSEAERMKMADAVTRLTAENRSYKTSSKEWRPGWKSLCTAFALGMAYAVYVVK